MTPTPRFVCVDCGGLLKKIYPDAPPSLAYAHLSLAAAEYCKSIRPDTHPWPVPREH